MNVQQQKQQISVAASQDTQPYTTIHQHCDSDSDSQTCSACSHSNGLEALYCEECGHSLQTSLCPQCGAAVEEGDDICEGCKTWLLVGQCMFCYATLESDDTFCSECGNPADGVVCPQCGSKGCFDYCGTCGIPLTETAHQLLVEAASDPQIQELVSLIDNFSRMESSLADLVPELSTVDAANREPVHSNHREELDALENYLARMREKNTATVIKPAAVSLFSQAQEESINRRHDGIVKEEERKRLEAEEKRRLEAVEAERQRVEAENRRIEAERQRELVNKMLESISDKNFRTSQDARRFFATIKAALSKEAHHKLNNYELLWKCNAYNCRHPNETYCSKPHKGGAWIFVPKPVDWEWGRTY